jgi:type I restriction enzyme S subunit
LTQNDTRGSQPLPDGWAWTTLGTIRVDKSHSITPKKTPEQRFELYSVPSFVEGKPEIVPGVRIGSSKRVVEEEAVLLCKINPRINRVWVVGDHSPYLKIASTEWIPFFKVEGITPDYLCYFMQQNDFRDLLTLRASGVGGSLMRIKPSTIADYPFPLAPLPEQYRIVAEIETQFTRLEAGVAALKRAQANLRRYKSSVLKAACEGRLVPTEAELARAEGRAYEPAELLLERILDERRAKWKAENPRKKYKEPALPDTSDLPELPEGWTWALVEQLGRIGEQAVLTGPFGSNLGRKDFVDSGVPILTIGCLKEQGLSLEKAFYVTERKATELDRYRVRVGDLLFSRMATVGRAGLVTSRFADSLVNYHLMTRLLQ